MDRTCHEEIAGLLHGLVVRLDDRLSDGVAAEVVKFIDVNELGLALELVADALSEHQQPLGADERADVLALSTRMLLGDRPRALVSCPEKYGLRGSPLSLGQATGSAAVRRDASVK